MNDYLLAGPMLRKVTNEVVCVWLATNREVSVTLSVFAGTDISGMAEFNPTDAASSNSNQHPQSESVQCALGKNLFIYLLQARPLQKNAFFPRDTLLTYQLEVDGQLVDLNALGLTYDNAARPSFFIPRQLKHLLQGSCRKPHGNTKDALSAGDTELLRSHNDLTQRPALLLLTGDQIYADDVAGAMLALLKAKAVEILGHQELLPWENLPESRFTHVKWAILRLLGKAPPAAIEKGTLFDPTELAERKHVAKRQAGFSSTEADNHLFTFGEYAAMYLYVLGNAGQWQPDFDLEENLEKRTALQNFHETLPKVRRLMANIPTYMICDDHDVTDDWNITGAWYDKVRRLALGQRVVANALASYWAFQGWGNAPEDFDAAFIDSIRDYFAAAPSPAAKVADRFDLNLWKYRGWGFSIPSNPPVIVLDSRTQRQPDGANYPPQLLDRYALDWLRVEWAKLLVKMEQDVDKGEIDAMPLCPIFVATTPVMGFAAIEGIQQLLLWAVGAIEDTFVIRTIEKWLGIEGRLTLRFIYQLDVEAWISNREGFKKFLNTLLDRMHVTQCVFLSGDVHYSFSSKACFRSNGKTLHCWQLTSSALCNTPSAKNAFDKINAIVNKEQGKFSHTNYALSAADRWQSSGEYLTLAGSARQQRITPTCNIGLVEFNNTGQPIKHSLLNGAVPEVFLL